MQETMKNTSSSSSCVEIDINIKKEYKTEQLLLIIIIKTKK